MIGAGDARPSDRTVFIADSEPPFRAGLRAVLEAAGLEVIGEAADARTAVDDISALAPALCLIGGDDAAGVLASKRLAMRSPELPFIVLVNVPSADGLLAVVRAGASGYLSRETSGSALVRIVEAVLRGEYAIPRLGLTQLINELHPDGRERLAIGGIMVSLTEREAQVARMLADGLETAAIAASLELSPVTIRRYVGAIGVKAGRPGRRQLVQALRAA